MFKTSKELLNSGKNFVTVNGKQHFVLAVIGDRLILEDGDSLKRVKINEVQHAEKIGGKMY